MEMRVFRKFKIMFDIVIVSKPDNKPARRVGLGGEVGGDVRLKHCGYINCIPRSTGITWDSLFSKTENIWIS